MVLPYFAWFRYRRIFVGFTSEIQRSSRSKSRSSQRSQSSVSQSVKSINQILKPFQIKLQTITTKYISEMNEVEKNQILSQISCILQFCQEIVSRLSSSSPPASVDLFFGLNTAQTSSDENDDAYDVGTQFSKETHIRDEDDEMRKFIETEMSKIKGSKAEDVNDDDEDKHEFLSPVDAAIRALPEHLTKSTFKKDQQMISSQMLTGIPEVDLGIDVKIQNIERTEKAKKKLLAENRKRDLELEDAQEFVQHDRWRDIQEIEMVREESEQKKKPVERPNTVNIYREDEDSLLRDAAK